MTNQTNPEKLSAKKNDTPSVPLEELSGSVRETMGIRPFNKEEHQEGMNKIQEFRTIEDERENSEILQAENALERAFEDNESHVKDDMSKKSLDAIEKINGFIQNNRVLEIHTHELKSGISNHKSLVKINRVYDFHNPHIDTYDEFSNDFSEKRKGPENIFFEVTVDLKRNEPGSGMKVINLVLPLSAFLDGEFEERFVEEVQKLSNNILHAYNEYYKRRNEESEEILRENNDSNEHFYNEEELLKHGIISFGKGKNASEVVEAQGEISQPRYSFSINNGDVWGIIDANILEPVELSKNLNDSANNE